MSRHSDDAVSPSTNRSIAIMVVGVAALAATVLGASPAGATNPSISVSPSSGLHAGQTVTVTGSGFSKGADVYIVECVAGASSETQCSFDFSDLSTVVVAKADGSGNVHSPSPVLKTSFKNTDCTKVTCEIAAHQTISFNLTSANTATHSISFGSMSHPSSGHPTPSGGTHPTTTGSTTSAASTSSSSSASTSGAASATAVSSTAAGSVQGSVSGSSQETTSDGASGAGSTATPSTVARTIKVKAKNGGRYAVVAVVGVLAVLFVGAMAASGRRRRS